jgi:hypothetical protein
MDTSYLLARPIFQVEDHFLDPELPLTAKTIKDTYTQRNKEFAKFIVQWIAVEIQKTPPVLDTKREERCFQYDGEGQNKWDQVLGYSVIDLFKSHQEGAITDLVTMDLELRGFRVVKFGLYVGDGECSRAAVECPGPCKEHFISLSWKLEFQGGSTEWEEESLELCCTQ